MPVVGLAKNYSMIMNILRNLVISYFNIFLCDILSVIYLALVAFIFYIECISLYTLSTNLGPREIYILIIFKIL